MSLTHLIHLQTGVVAGLLLSLFVISSLNERRERAAWVGFTVLVVFSACWIAVHFVFGGSPLLICFSLGLALFALFFFFPFRPGKPLRIEDVSERVDERDVIFAREEYLPGSEKYETYYKTLKPEHRETDDKLRALPELLRPGGRFHVPEQAAHVAGVFRLIEGMLEKVDGPVMVVPKPHDPEELTGRLKRLAQRLGADTVGIARLNPAFCYSHVGRGPEPWGAPIDNSHAFVIVFTLEMGYEQVETAPRMGITEESAVQYLKGAHISIGLARYIRALGFPARAHIAGSNYQIMLPPVAHEAGLGELGRIGYLISEKRGARIRLGAVTTDIELIPDRPVCFGVQDFCEKCRKCATHCPSGAIPRGGKTWVRGVEKWQLDIEKCMRYWRTAGTDCGLCMKVCPYSHPPTFIHNVVRAGLKVSPFARTVSAWGDDFFYGRRLPRSLEE